MALSIEFLTSEYFTLLLLLLLLRTWPKRDELDPIRPLDVDGLVLLGRFWGVLAAEVD